MDATTAVESELDARFAMNVVPAVARRASSVAGCGPPHGASDLADVLPSTTSTTPRAGGGAVATLETAATICGAPNRTRVDGLACLATYWMDASAPSPSSPVIGTDQGVQATLAPFSCAVASTIGARRSRSSCASTSASPPPAAASEVSSVALAGIHPEQRTKPGARSERSRMDRFPTVASISASPRVGAAYVGPGSWVSTCAHIG